jgi:predicted AlkP superfamily phosphohydrolase/phosphomutase
MRRALTFLVFLSLPAAAIFQAGCGRADSQTRLPKVIVLGIDGMDPHFVEAHIGSLPNVEKLAKEGEFKRLATVIPPQSPVAWSTFITGMDPGGHGIYDFIHRNPETLTPYSSMEETSEGGSTLSIGPYILPLSKGHVRALRQGKAFWEYLAARHVPVTILRMPTNYPPVECEGQALSGMGTPDMLGTFGTFTYYTDEASAQAKDVAGGQIIPVQREGERIRLQIQGPVNSLRKDRRRSVVDVVVDIDPKQPVARFDVGGEQFVLSQGEWSHWVREQFPLIPYVKSAAGMFRLYVKELHPNFKLYVSPINIDPFSPELPISTPSSYSKELAEAVGPYYTQGMPEDTAAYRQNVFTRGEYIQQSRIVSREHLALLRHAVDQFHDGLLFFHFFGVDQDSHMLWGKDDADLLDTYRMVDETVGWIRQKAPDATLIVMSDHGFSTFDRAVHMNSWLLKEGFLVLNEGARPGDEEVFANVDWSRTQAYSVGLNGLYLNMEGRERNGIVTPSDAAAVIGKITARLKEFKDPKTGRPVVDDVYRSSEVFHGNRVNAAPDLLIGYNNGFRSSWQTALGAVPAEEIVDNTEAWAADHCIAPRHVPGVLISNRKSKLPDPQLIDLPVSLLSTFSVQRGERMRGREIY